MCIKWSFTIDYNCKNQEILTIPSELHILSWQSIFLRFIDIIYVKNGINTTNIIQDYTAFLTTVL